MDVQKLFADYYKTHEAQAEVDKAAQTVQETNNTRAETIKKMEADFNDMVKRLQDPMLNEKDKKELEQKAQIKRQEVIALEQERRGFVERQLKSLQEQMKVRSAKIMGEITKITEGIATKGNYDLVLDKSAQALRSNQVFVYTKPGTLCAVFSSFLKMIGLIVPYSMKSANNHITDVKTMHESFCTETE